MKKYSALTLGEIEAMVNKLGGLDGVEKFLRGEIVVSRPDGGKIWEVWKTIVIGQFKSGEEIIKKLFNNKCDYTTVESILENSFPIYKSEREVCLVKVKLKDLGLEKITNWNDFLSVAENLGLIACPPEVGPQLRLQYKNQEEGEILITGMHGLTDPSLDKDEYHVFNVWRGPNGNCIDTVNPLKDEKLLEDPTFIFVLGPLNR